MVGKQFSVQKLARWITRLSLLALIISGYLLYLHYSTSESFCDFSASLSCDIVNKSIYSEFPPGSGIPVSLMGLITFLIILFIVQRITHKNILLSQKKILASFLFYLMIVSLLFALYLIYTELFLILSICVLCVVLDIIIVLVLYLSYKLRGVIYGTI